MRIEPRFTGHAGLSFDFLTLVTVFETEMAHMKCAFPDATFLIQSPCPQAISHDGTGIAATCERSSGSYWSP
jgi:hypothetical protein